MDHFEKQERQREARQRLSAHRRRAGELRGRVVAISLICFALLWGIVFVQMATGNDPVLSAKRSASGRSGGQRKAAAKPTAESEAAAEPVETEVEPEAEFAPEEEFESEEEFEPEPEFESEEFVPEEETEFIEPEPEPLVTSQS